MQLPTLLKQQYLRALEEKQSLVPNNFRPLIGRFYGVVACIDICGFSHLSNLLDSQQLLMHINNYFREMISIIQSGSGDVIKFAGDSIFVIWRADIPSSSSSGSSCCDNSAVLKRLRTTLIHAIGCIVRVHQVCGSYSINLGNVMSILSPTTTRLNPVDIPSNEMYTLTLHSGLSAGIIGACDVGRIHRRELLIVGGPVFEVGQALAIASKGHIVVSNIVQEILQSEPDPIRDNLCRALVPLSIVTGSLADAYSHIPEETWPLFSEFAASIEYNLLNKPKLNAAEAETAVLALDQEQQAHFSWFAEVHGHEAFRLLDADSQSQGEIRPVVTMFIKIYDSASCFNRSRVAVLKLISGECKDSQLLPDEYGFLGDGEIFSQKQDRMLANRLQAHLDVILEVLSEHRGQLRQYIFDDKGLIGIGTFGLKGSTSDNISEPAIHAAMRINELLQKSGYQVSIGMSYGRALCGMLGTDQRAEYAVIGSCVNLAARIMNHAQPGQVLCDSHLHDRVVDSFNFSAPSKLRAKGYSNLVDVYQVMGSTMPSKGAMRSPSYKELPENTRESIKVIRQQQAIDCINIFLEDIHNVKRQKKIIVIEGRPKYGLSMLLKSIASQLQTQLPPSKHVLAMASLNTFHCSKPYSVWTLFLNEIRSQLARQLDKLPKTIHEEAILNYLGDKMRSDLHLANHLMPTELQLQTEGSAAPTSMSSSIIQMKLSALMFQLLKAYIRAAGVESYSINIIIDNVQWIDLCSWNLVVQCTTSIANFNLILGLRVDAHNLSNGTSLGSRVATHEASEHCKSIAGKVGWLMVDVNHELDLLSSQSVSSSFRSWKAPYDIRRMVLDPLDRELTGELASMIIPHKRPIGHGIQSRLQLADMIFKISQGDPMMIYQIASAIACSHDTADTGTSSDSPCSCEGSEIIQTDLKKLVEMARAEDIIVHRFDNMPGEKQAILQIASCMSYLVPITADIISYVLTCMPLGSIAKGVHSSQYVVHHLSFMATSGDFLRAIEGTDPVWYEFHTELERDVVRGLMVDEKINTITNFIADYLRLKLNNTSGAMDNYVTGYHYAKARNYHNAIVWYYAAAKLLEEEGYMMQCSTLLDDALQCFYSLQSKHGIHLRSGVDNDDMKVLCADDTAVLQAIVSVLVTYTRIAYHTSSKDFAEMYEFSFEVVQSVAPFSIANGTNEMIIHDDRFVMADASPICLLLPLLLLHTMVSDKPNLLDHIKETMMRTCASLDAAAAFVDRTVHRLRASILRALCLNCLGSYDKLATIADDITSKYNFDEHHEQMIAIFSVDRTCQALAQSECSLAFYGPPREGRGSQRYQYLDTICSLTSRTNHILTVSLSYLPLLPALVLRNDFALALDLFMSYLKLTDSNSFIFFKWTNATVAIWLTRLVLHRLHKGSKVLCRRNIQGDKQMIDSMFADDVLSAQDHDLLSILTPSKAGSRQRSPVKAIVSDEVTAKSPLAVMRLYGMDEASMRAETCLLEVLTRLQQSKLRRSRFNSSDISVYSIHSSPYNGCSDGRNKSAVWDSFRLEHEPAVASFSVRSEDSEMDPKNPRGLGLTASPFESFRLESEGSVDLDDFDDEQCTVSVPGKRDPMGMAKWCKAGLLYLQNDELAGGADIEDTRFQTSTLRHYWIKIELLCSSLLLIGDLSEGGEPMNDPQLICEQARVCLANCEAALSRCEAKGNCAAALVNATLKENICFLEANYETNTAECVDLLYRRYNI